MGKTKYKRQTANKRQNKQKLYVYDGSYMHSKWNCPE